MKILCIGDSLTEGDYGVYGKTGIANVKEKNYPYFLSEILKTPVINEGKCGFNASAYLEYYCSKATVYDDVSLIIVMLGTNGGMSISSDSQGAMDYERLICKLRSDYPNAKLAICTAPHATNDPSKSNYGYAGNVKSANEFICKYAKENDILLFDAFSIPQFSAENEAVMQPNDGLHFSEDGYRILAEFIAGKIIEEKCFY